jgi:membrane associated rhomboid family serine protease
MYMNDVPASIPRPLVRANQWVIVLSVIFTWITGAYGVLAIPLVAGLLGILFNFNPIMRVAKLLLKKSPSSYVQEDREQQRFNQLLAVLFLLVALVGFAFHWTALAYVFSAMVLLAAFVAILGFCIGCFMLYQWSQYQYRRRKHV